MSNYRLRELVTERKRLRDAALLDNSKDVAAYIAHAANTDAELAELVEAVLRENEAKHALIKDLERWLEEERGDRLYCPTCGGCGEAGCCSPCNCVRVRCAYGDTNLKDYRELLDELEASERELAALRARCEGLEAALKVFTTRNERVLGSMSTLEMIRVHAADDSAYLHVWASSELPRIEQALSALKEAPRD